MDDRLETVEDPVCEMRIDPETAAWEIDYNEERWFFCSSRCKELFMANPLLYVERASDEENRETTTG